MATDPRYTVPPHRKTLYYVGNGLTAFGFLLFLSTFVTAAINFGDFTDFAGRARSSMFRAVGGMVLIVVGQGLALVGRFGAAGSGLLLDPRRARQDVEPWSRMAGGMADDALSEVKTVKPLIDRLAAPPPAAVPPAVKVRCRQCQALNDETAKFCNQCGAAV